jgi:hypothetical protein
MCSNWLTRLPAGQDYIRSGRQAREDNTAAAFGMKCGGFSRGFPNLGDTITVKTAPTLSSDRRSAEQCRSGFDLQGWREYWGCRSKSQCNRDFPEPATSAAEAAPLPEVDNSRASSLPFRRWTIRERARSPSGGGQFASELAPTFPPGEPGKRKQCGDQLAL